MPERASYPPSAEIEIDASLLRVWHILLDGEGYGSWNGFIPEAKGKLDRLNTPIHMRVQLGRREVRAVMQTIEIEPPAGGRALWAHEHASWLAKTGLVRSRRFHELTAITPSRTRYRTWEPFSGLLKAFVPYAEVDAGFKQQAADLKSACEIAR